MRDRLHSVDIVRGLVMVLMALDHSRDFFGDLGVNPVDLETASPLLFFTRWATHFCAPTFVFLAGVGIGLRVLRSENAKPAAHAGFLLSRGLWLLVLEFTVVNFAWTFDLTPPFYFWQVIAAIGVAMVAMAGLVFLPRGAVVAVGLAIVLGHNLLDPIRVEDLGDYSTLWILLHEGSRATNAFAEAPFGSLFVIYPVLPWIGVMALGYGYASVLERPRAARRATCLVVGAAMVLGFVVLRLLGSYGNVTPATEQDTLLLALASFLNCEKYPPSLTFTLMTLGPALLALAVFDRDPERPPGRITRALTVFGRVPMFFYLAHFFVLHTGALAWRWLAYDQWLSPISAAINGTLSSDYPTSLGATYIAWLLCVIALLPACHAYGALRRRNRFLAGYL